MKRTLVTLIVVLGALLCAPAALAQSSGGEQCSSCHEEESQTHAKNYGYHGECTTCHVNAVDHAKTEEARESGEEILKSIAATLPKTEQCMSCHVSDAKHMNFAFSEHNKAGVQCSDCHGNHSPKIKTINASLARANPEVALCVSCHQGVLANFNQRSHHPVKEGAMTCTDCHNTHGSQVTTLAANTQQCTQCHQNVRGPHAFEHPPAVEDCASCHSPHGSPNRKMLTLSEPMLCIQCHSVAGNRHGQAGGSANGQRISPTALRNCSSCHNAPHGSSNDQHLRF
ncbi:cytochrome c3 family protein [Rhodocyclaceae bacterium SMB388]